MLSVIFIDAKCAKSEVIDLQAVIRSAKTLSIYAPLANSALRTESTVAAEVKIVASIALITVSSDEVESTAVEVIANARTEAQGFSLSAASKTRADLHAFSSPHSVAFLLAAQAVTSKRIINIAERRNVNAEDSVT